MSAKKTPKKPAAKRRLTKRQDAILRQLRKLKTHPTATNFYTQVKGKFPRMNLAKLAEDLDSLVKKGLAQELTIEGAGRRYDGNTDSHYHIACMHCGRVDDISINIVAAMDRAVGLESGYEIIKHSIVYFGLCKKCRKLAAGKH